MECVLWVGSSWAVMCVCHLLVDAGSIICAPFVSLFLLFCWFGFPARSCFSFGIVFLVDFPCCFHFLFAWYPLLQCNSMSAFSRHGCNLGASARQKDFLYLYHYLIIALAASSVMAFWAARLSKTKEEHGHLLGRNFRAAYGPRALSTSLWFFFRRSLMTLFRRLALQYFFYVLLFSG